MQPNPESSALRTRPTAEPETGTGRERLRFLVAIEFSSKDAAVDHMVDLMTIGWPKGPKVESLRLIVISRMLEQGHIVGLEVPPQQLSQLNKMMSDLTG